MATTTNFGWSTPDDTALVSQGAAAMRTLGSSIDSSMGELLGGTTGQILSKTTGTNMDFTWIASGGQTLLSTTTLSGATTTISSIPQTYRDLKLVIVGATPATASQLSLGWAGTAMDLIRWGLSGDSVSLSSAVTTGTDAQINIQTIRQTSGGGNGGGVYTINIYEYASTTANKVGNYSAQNLRQTNYNTFDSGFLGFNAVATAVTSLSIKWVGGYSSNAGTAYLYGIK